MQRESYSLKCTGASTVRKQATRHNHTSWYWPLLSKRRWGISSVHVGVANTKLTTGIFSPVPQSYKSEMIGSAGKQTLILCPDQKTKLLTILTPYLQLSLIYM